MRMALRFIIVQRIQYLFLEISGVWNILCFESNFMPRLELWGNLKPSGMQLSVEVRYVIPRYLRMGTGLYILYQIMEHSRYGIESVIWRWWIWSQVTLRTSARQIQISPKLITAGLPIPDGLCLPVSEGTDNTEGLIIVTSMMMEVYRSLSSFRRRILVITCWHWNLSIFLIWESSLPHMMLNVSER